MTLSQVRTYIKGVLSGWFTNKAILDKIGENENGVFTYNGQTINNQSQDTVDDTQINAAVLEDIAELNSGASQNPSESESGNTSNDNTDENNDTEQEPGE